MNKSLMNKGLCALLSVALLVPFGGTLVPFGGSFAAVTSPEVTVPQFVPPALSTVAPTTMLGYAKGAELLINANYTDMTKNTFLKEVTKMSAMGVIRKYGATTFRPGSAITGYEALTMLVQARGREAAVQRRISAASTAAIASGTPLTAAALKTLYNTEYARESQTLAIITLAEQVDLAKTVNREKLAAWSAKSISLQPDFNDLTGVYSFKDAADVSPLYRNFVEAMVGQKLIYLPNDSNFKPKSTMTRGEFAKTLEHMSDRFMTNLATTAEFGLVIGKKSTTEVLSGARVTKNIFTVKSIDGKLIQIVAQVNQKTKVKNELVTYKNGVVSDSRQLAIGDEITYLMKNNEVFYAEAINDDTLLDKMKETADNGDGIVVHFGTVGLVVSQSRFENGKSIDSKRTRLKDFDGNVYDLNIETNPKTGIKNDIIVYKTGNGGGSNLLKEGDNVEYYVKDGKTLIYMKVLPVNNKAVAGTLRTVGANAALKTNTVSIYDYNDKIVEYPVAQHALVKINGNYAHLKDLQNGQDLKMTIQNGYITNIDTETFTDNPGAISNYGKMRMGSIYYLYNDSILFDLSNGQRAQYMVPSTTQIIRDGITTTMRALKEGDQVKLYFNDIYSNKVDRIEVEGAERLIKQVYKGEIKEVNPTSGIMTLSFPAVLKNTGWVQSDTYMMDIPYSEKTLIYSGSNQVRPKDFARLYKDKTAYVVVEENYGTETAVKVTIRSGGELMTYDTVDKLDATLNSMELYNKENYTFNEGTIVIKDGRMIDPGRIKRFDSAYVVGDYFMGSKTANVVRLVTRVESIFDNLYVGALSQVDYNSLTFKNYAKMSGNQWGTVEPNVSRRFYFTTDTAITNITNIPTVSIKSADFFHKGFSEEENKDKNNQGLKFERYYGLFVTDGADIIRAINLRQKGLVKDQNIDDSTTDEVAIKGYINDTLKGTSLTRGTVESTDTKWTRLQLTNSNEWSSTLATWNANSVDTWVKYENTLILKNNKVIQPEEIKQGDSVYVLRNKETALVIFVEGK